MQCSANVLITRLLREFFRYLGYNTVEMSRVRKVDKHILEKQSYLDTDDQEELIRSLAENNRGAYTTYRNVLMVFELVQLTLMMVLNKVRGVPMLGAVVVSIVLSMVDMAGVQRWRVVRGANVVVVVVLVWSMGWDHFEYLLPAIDLGCTWYLRSTHEWLTRDIGRLEGLKYKFKTV